jgi:hypothetical protein
MGRIAEANGAMRSEIEQVEETTKVLGSEAAGRTGEW